MSDVENGRGFRTLPELVLSSPLLPLPVEFVAGGEGRPDGEPGLESGGSGSLGKSGGEAVEVEPRDPMYIADKGRCLCVKDGRGGIG